MTKNARVLSVSMGDDNPVSVVTGDAVGVVGIGAGVDRVGLRHQCEGELMVDDTPAETLEDDAGVPCVMREASVVTVERDPAHVESRLSAG